VTLARRTGARVAVSGSFYQAGDSLLFQAELTDAASGRILRVIGPIAAPAARPVAALYELRSHVMTGLAFVFQLRTPVDLIGEEELPSFEAYQSYIEGSDAFIRGDGPAAERYYLRAAHLDTSFTSAAIGAAAAAANHHDCDRVDSLARIIDRPSRPLNHISRLSLGIAQAMCAGRNEDMLRLTLERANLAPRTSAFQMNAVAAASWANRPATELAILRRIDPSTDLGWSTDTTHFGYYGSLVGAYHALGMYEEELAVTEREPHSAPLSRIWMRAPTLAALHRPAEALALLDSVFKLPVETENNFDLAPFTDGRPEYTPTAGWVAMWAARELFVHDEAAAARQAAERGIAWYLSQPPEERATYEERTVMASSLELIGSYEEAERIWRGLLAEDTSNVDYRGSLAGIAAMRGDTARADSLERWLAAQHGEHVGWTPTLYLARTAALLGRADSAVVYLRETVALGALPYLIHAEPAFRALRSRRDFIELTLPRD